MPETVGQLLILKRAPDKRIHVMKLLLFFSQFLRGLRWVHTPGGKEAAVLGRGGDAPPCLLSCRVSLGAFSCLIVCWLTKRHANSLLVGVLSCVRVSVSVCVCVCACVNVYIYIYIYNHSWYVCVCICGVLKLLYKAYVGFCFRPTRAFSLLPRMVRLLPTWIVVSHRRGHAGYLHAERRGMGIKRA